MVRWRVECVSLAEECSRAHLERTTTRVSELIFLRFVEASTSVAEPLALPAEHAVCSKEYRAEGALAFPRLETGKKFIHPMFGIVEVINDDREEVTYKYPKDVQTKSRAHLQYRDRINAAHKKNYPALRFRSMLRRYKLNRNQALDNVNQLTCFKIYFGRHLDQLPEERRSLPPKKSPPVDPFLVPEAKGDRMVECKPIVDARRRLYSHKLNLSGRPGEEDQPQSARVPLAAKLFIRRFELKHQYSPGLDVFVCRDCGSEFLSKDGFNYHTTNKVCINQAKSQGRYREETINVADDRLSRHLRRQSTRKKEKIAVYPQVWFGLGFKVLARSKAPIQLTANGASQDETYAKIKGEFSQLLWPQGDARHGAMYRGVFKHLGFRKPVDPKAVKPPKPKVVKPVEPDTTDEDDGSEDGIIIPKPKTILPVIDLQVLIDEVKSGRYPSMKPYRGEFPDTCCICKEGGELLCCDFCPSTVHLLCFFTKFEFALPQDDFMCYKCVQRVMARRSRAEKRRVRKLQEVMEKEAGEKSCEKRAEEEAKERDIEGATLNAVNTIPDPEEPTCPFETVAKSGKELSELLELLDESRNRLVDMTRTSSFNDFRRAQIHASLDTATLPESDHPWDTGDLLIDGPNVSG